jgi:hypothetical protein
MAVPKITEKDAPFKLCLGGDFHGSQRKPSEAESRFLTLSWSWFRVICCNQRLHVLTADQ